MNAVEMVARCMTHQPAESGYLEPVVGPASDACVPPTAEVLPPLQPVPGSYTPIEESYAWA